MADNPIKHSDIIQPGNPLDDLIKGLEKTLKLLKEVAKEHLKFAKAQDVSTKKGKKNLQAVSQATQQLTIKEKEALKIKKQLEIAQAKLALAGSKENKQLIKTREAINAKNAALRKAAKEMRTGAKSTNTWGKALGSFAFKFNALGNIAANVASKITRVFSRAIRGAIKTIMDFEQAMADVRAVTNPTDKDFKKLSKSARDLGGATKFTAIEVAKLQKELGKLGLTTEEVLNAQAAVLDLAAATGAELPRAAEVAGITLRQFGLDASEMRRVVDVMAQSFRTSPLDIEKFAESMKFVGPVAKKVGFTLEETTARLAQMAKAGISGSLGGTALRMIFIQLAKSGKDVSEGLRELTMEELGLADAVEAVKVRAATALTVLADSSDVMDEYTESLNRAKDAAQEMADIQIATLEGQVTILKSSWDKLILSLATSEEEFIFLKAVLAGTSGDLKKWSDNIEDGKEEQSKFNIALKENWKIIKQTFPIWGPLAKQHEIVTARLLAERDAANKLKDSFVELNEEVVEEAPGDVQLKMVETLKTLGKELSDLKEKRQNASISEIAAVNREIAALEAKIKKFKEAGDALPTIKEIKEFADEEIKIEEFKIDEINTKNKENRKFQLAARKRFAEEDKAIKEKQAADDKKIEDEKQAKIQASFDLANQLTTTFSSIFAAQKEKELSAVGDNAEARLEIEKKFAKKEQALAIGQAVVDGAAAIIKTWRNMGGFPAALPFAIAQAAIVATQIGVIASQKFAEGEVDIYGPSHSRGGINAEIEGGESVINKRSTAKHKTLLEAINANDSAAIADAALHNQAFHEVWGRTGIKETTANYSDPYMKKMYEVMLNTPQVGPLKDRIEYYPNGKTRIING